MLRLKLELVLRNTFNLFVILSFRLELRRPPDVNREGAIFLNYNRPYQTVSQTTVGIFS